MIELLRWRNLSPAPRPALYIDHIDQSWGPGVAVAEAQPSSLNTNYAVTVTTVTCLLMARRGISPQSLSL